MPSTLGHRAPKDPSRRPFYTGTRQTGSPSIHTTDDCPRGTEPSGTRQAIDRTPLAKPGSFKACRPGMLDSLVDRQDREILRVREATCTK